MQINATHLVDPVAHYPPSKKMFLQESKVLRMTFLHDSCAQSTSNNATSVNTSLLKHKLYYFEIFHNIITPHPRRQSITVDTSYKLLQYCISFAIIAAVGINYNSGISMNTHMSY